MSFWLRVAPNMDYFAELALSRLWAEPKLQYHLNQRTSAQVRWSRILRLRRFLLGVAVVGGDSSRPSVSDSSVDGILHFFIIPEIDSRKRFSHHCVLLQRLMFFMRPSIG